MKCWGSGEQRSLPFNFPKPDPIRLSRSFVVQLLELEGEEARPWWRDLTTEDSVDFCSERAPSRSWMVPEGVGGQGCDGPS